MKLALYGQQKFCEGILKMRLEEKAYGGGYRATHYVVDDNPPLTTVTFSDCQELIARHEVDAIVIEMHHTTRREVGAMVRRCKDAGIKVGVSYDPRNRDVYWLDPAKGFLRQVEAHMADVCNLNCRLCSHFTPLFTEPNFPKLDSFQRDVHRLAEKFDLALFFFLGGEPLLNPRLADYIKVVATEMPRTFLTVVSNGLLIPSAPDGLLDCMREHNVLFSISAYPPTERIVDRIAARLRQHGVSYQLRGSADGIDKFRKRHWDAPKSDPELVYPKCSGDVCRYLRDGKLYKCPADGLSWKFNEHFKTNTFPPSAGVDIYADDVVEQVARLDGAIELCRYCTDDVRWYPWEVSRGPRMSDWIIDN